MRSEETAKLRPHRHAATDAVAHARRAGLFAYTVLVYQDGPPTVGDTAGEYGEVVFVPSLRDERRAKYQGMRNRRAA